MQSKFDAMECGEAVTGLDLFLSVFTKGQSWEVQKIGNAEFNLTEGILDTVNEILRLSDQAGSVLAQSVGAGYIWPQKACAGSDTSIADLSVTRGVEACQYVDLTTWMPLCSEAKWWE